MTLRTPYGSAGHIRENFSTTGARVLCSSNNLSICFRYSPTRTASSLGTGSICPSHPGMAAVGSLTGRTYTFPSSVICFICQTRPLTIVQANMSHREHELFAENSNRLLAGQINHMISSLVRNHAQVLVVVHPSPRCPVERLFVSSEMPHFPHELDNLLQLSLLELRIGKRSLQNLFDVAESDAAFGVHQ